MKENIFKPYNKHINNTLVFMILALFVYCYFGSFSFFESNFSHIQDFDYWKIIYHHLSAFFLFFCCGLVITKFVNKTPLKEVGLRAGNWKLGLILCAIATFVVPLLGLSTVLDSGMKATYPLVDLHKYGSFWHVAGYFGSYVLYYIGWEFLFRGMGLFEMEKGGISPLSAILLTTLVSALIHTSIAGFGKPMVETLSAIPAGLVFGFIAWKTKSIFYGLYMHALVGICTDVFIFLLA